MLSCSRNSRFLPLLATLSLASFGLASCNPALAQTAVLTQNNDNSRTGANTSETALTPANVKVAGFGKLFTITGMNANVNGQVLYVPSVVIGGASHNVVYAYTSNNTDHSPCGLYAYDADSGQSLWKTVLPNSATYTTATPVIDPATSTIYVLTKTDNDDTGLTYLHAFDITTGQDKPGSPIQVQASAPGTGDGSVTVSGIPTVYFDGDHGNGRFHANDRAGLLFSNGVVYAGFAHNSDSNPYHGWILGYQYDGTAFTQKYVFCTTPNGSASTTPGGGDGGVWQAGKGLTADADGNLYFSIGNGTFDANAGGIDYGMCYVKLSPALKVLDWFAPYDQQTQSSQDLDLGNTGLAGIPGTTSLFGGATKFGSAFLLDSTNLGHFTPNGPDKVLDRINSVSGNDNVGQNPISWDSGSYKYVYLWPSGVPIRQFRYDPSIGNFNPSGIFTVSSNSTTVGGSLAVSSSATSNAILWAVGNDKVVRAYDATNVGKSELWDSSQNSSRDSLGSVGHFQFPTVVNGKVYVPTGSSTIAVYGLLAATPPPTASPIQINAGGGASGSFAADTDFSGSSSTYSTTAAISTTSVTNPAPQAVYQTERYGNFTYTLPNLTPGASYTLRLHFAENYWTSANQRLFNVSVNGASVLSNFDIFAAAGGANKAVVETYLVTADSSGKVTVVFTSVKDYAKLSGLELTAAQTNAAQINAGGSGSGSFAADTDFSGSSSTYSTTAAISTTSVTNPAPQAVYQTERYGNFTYTLPNLTPGASYTLHLHFAELYWNAAGQRVFNVAVNGTPVLSNFDIFAAAGGANKAIVETFTVQADSSGKVTVVFTTVKDYAKLSGLELLQ